jgi:hypothetical protein
MAIALCTSEDCSLASDIISPSYPTLKAIRIDRWDEGYTETARDDKCGDIECIRWEFVRVADLAPPETQSEWRKVLECSK